MARRCYVRHHGVSMDPPVAALRPPIARRWVVSRTVLLSLTVVMLTVACEDRPAPTAPPTRPSMSVTAPVVKGASSICRSYSRARNRSSRAAEEGRRVHPPHRRRLQLAPTNSEQAAAVRCDCRHAGGGAGRRGVRGGRDAAESPRLLPGSDRQHRM